MSDDCLVLDAAADSESLVLDLGNTAFTVRSVEILAGGVRLRAGLLSLLLGLIITAILRSVERHVLARISLICASRGSNSDRC